MKPGWVLRDQYWLPSNDPFIKSLGVGRVMQSLVAQHVTDWSCMIDGGAHAGVWSVTFAPKFKRVIAVELAPDMAECLVENVRNSGNVEVINAALADKEGAVGWEPDEDKKSTVRRVVEGTSVPKLTIDSLNLPTLGLLKLDLQGYDFLALLGARETIKRCKPIVVFEWKDRCGKRYGVQKNDIPNLLTKLGLKPIWARHIDQMWGPA